ncbi:outer membrane protein transport protein [Moritella viscosa]|uniref:Long-chain fatty acid transport protein n=1 Tax=Moritella viscosa TaxID=80854 RepID=A0ABY1HCW6_9GAMM|nr:outer membrane protein transport protein [Moritella viscosa]SGY85951.1 Putative long-chain fatty acid transport protein [Moritella viscosa]SGY87245.1 Putative long-chain fatty acid transport protein [Moritella viscosa]SGY87251.1 Putative long-chain fatty acid transport protein [Moritella viscosa]SGY89255.1 Putative long-chain fatty acid transport protein [Moritella viscosa]SHO24865.1 Putative long-chain fatty acid transport protein [Moritella viscosa]
MSKLKKTTLATALLLVTAQSSAAGFQVSEHSASGLGRAFAGEAAVADNASVLARNPAAMTRFKQAELSFAGSYVEPNVDITGVKDTSVGAVLGRDVNELNADDMVHSAFVPATYFIQPINDKLTFGLGIFSSYGVTTEFEDDYAAGAAAGKTDLLTLNINPNIAFKATEQLSLGFGVSAVYGKAAIKRNYGDIIAAGGFSAAKKNGASDADAAATARAVNNPGKELFLLEGDAWAIGWNTGALYEINKNNRIGLAYRSQVDLDFEGDFTGVTSGDNKVKASLDLPLPATAEFSGYHALNESFAVSYSVLWTEWSKFEELRATSSSCKDGECFLKEESFNDSMRYSIGAEYTIDKVILRAGFALDESAGETTLSIPESDRFWYTVGATYNASSNLSLDFGVAYIYVEEVEFTETPVPGMEYGFKSSGDAIIASAQANYRF